MIQTVLELWREWTVGLGFGQPSVQSLEDSYGAIWRPEQKERVFFSRRKVIIDEIRRRAAERGGNTAAIVEELELIRQWGKFTLHGLWQVLNQPRRRESDKT